MKIENKILAAFLCLLIVMTLGRSGVNALSTLPRTVDYAELLTDEEAAELTQTLDEISEAQQLDVVVLTTDSLDGKTVMEYADDFFDYNGYGYGQDADGVLLIVCMATKDVWISTSGYGITAFTDYGINYILDEIAPYLSDGDFYNAFFNFAYLCDIFIDYAKEGEPIDIYSSTESESESEEAISYFSLILIALAIGVIAGFIGTGIMKGKLKSVRNNSAADNYIIDNSMELVKSQDIFLYHTVTKTLRESSRSSSGGGSSTHRSSSGRTHGGGGRKF